MYQIVQSEKWPWPMWIEDEQGLRIASVDLLEWSSSDTQETANARDLNKAQRALVNQLVELANRAEVESAE